MKHIYMIFLTFLLINSKAVVGQIEDKSIIGLLNFQTTLIQDVEMRFLWYEKSMPPDDVGKLHQQVLNFHEQELRNVHQASDPEVMRKTILESVELYKMYGKFRFSDDNFFFKEINLVFQVRSDSTVGKSQFDYRMELIDQFENYPSLGFKHYFNGGDLKLFIVNANQGIKVTFPNQFENDRSIWEVSKGYMIDRLRTVSFPFQLAPTFIDETKAEIVQPKLDGNNYVITHFPFEKVMTKIYVSVVGLPKVLREEFYYQYPSPNANEERYWLGTVGEYSDFSTIDKLSIVVPKVYEEKEYRKDGFLRRITKVTIQEMVFNQGLPATFFDWDGAEIAGYTDKREEVRDDVEKVKSQDTQQRTTK